MPLPDHLSRLMDAVIGNVPGSSALAGRSPGDNLRLLVTAVTLVGTLIAAVIGLSSPSANDGSSTSDPGTPEYVLPTPEIQTQLQTIQGDMVEAVNTWRFEANLPVLTPLPERQSRAQDKAEFNAATGTMEPSVENISMLQDRLPLYQASGYAFAERLRNSPQHMAVIRDPEQTQFAVATAYSDGQVYLVIQFEK